MSRQACVERIHVCVHVHACAYLSVYEHVYGGVMDVAPRSVQWNTVGKGIILIRRYLNSGLHSYLPTAV